MELYTGYNNYSSITRQHIADIFCYCSDAKQALDRLTGLRILGEPLFNAIPKSDVATIIFTESIGELLNNEDKFQMFLELIDALEANVSDFVITANELISICSVNNVELTRKLLELGCTVRIKSNVVKQAVYANKLDMAKMFLDMGFKAPEKITMYAITNQMGWDPERLLFMLNNQVELDIKDAEKRCICILLTQITKGEPSISEYVYNHILTDTLFNEETTV